MGYAEAENKLLASIEEDDPYQASKQLQIKRWFSAYWPLMQSWGERKALFFQEVFGDEACWEATNTLEQVKLNRYIVGKKLLVLKTENGQKSFLNSFDQYKIACWCCFEEEIKTFFEKFKLERGDESVEDLVRKLNKGALMVFWSHTMNNQEHQLKMNNEHPYVYAFRCAIVEKFVEALEFFWNKLQSIDTVPLERKEDLLMQAALYKAIHVSANAEMVDFCLRHLSSDKYPELLKRDLAKNSYYSTISKLECDYFFEGARKLFELLKPEEFSFNGYSSSIYSVLGRMNLTTDNNFITAGKDFLTFIWNCQGFEIYKQSFLNELSRQFSASRDLINSLVMNNKAIPILSEIINSLSQEQMQCIMEDSPLSYRVFTTVKGKLPDDSVKMAGLTIVRSSNSSLDIETLKQEVILLSSPKGLSSPQEGPATSGGAKCCTSVSVLPDTSRQ